MKTQSTEIHKKIGELSKRQRATHAEIEAAKEKQKKLPVGSLKWLDLDDQIKALQAQLPAYPGERRKLYREYAEALSAEIEDLRGRIAKAKATISPKLKTLIDELEEIHKSYEAKLLTLIKPHLPEGASLPDLKLSLEIRNQHIERYPLDNAAFYLWAPIEAVLSGKKAELDSTIRELGR